MLRCLSHRAIRWVLTICIVAIITCFNSFSQQTKEDITALEDMVKAGQYELATTIFNQLQPQEITDPLLKFSYLKSGAQLDQINYDNSKALEKLLQLQDLGQDIDHDHYLSASIELANFFTMQDQVNDALTVFEEVKPLVSTNSAITCRYHHRKAFAYNQMGVLDSAKYESYTALQFAQKHNLLEAKGTIYNELANIFEKESELDSALKYYNLACDVYQGNLRYFSNAHFNLARLTMTLGDATSAIAMLEDNLASIDTTDWITIKSPIHFHLYLGYLHTGDTLKALQHQEKHLNDYIEILQLNHEKQYQELHVKYQSSQKDEQIEDRDRQIADERQLKLLWTSIALLGFVVLGLMIFIYRNSRLKNKRLKQLLEENQFLMQESNHRVKNNLQLVISLLNRQLLKEELDDDTISSLRNVSNQINSIAGVHSQLYKYENIKIIHLKKLIEDIIAQFERSLESHHIQISTNLSDVEIDISTGVNIALLINELITNSIKHAFSETEADNQILLEMIVDSSFLKIKYSDNGNGSISNKEPKLLSLLLQQLKANYTLNLENGMNLEFTVKLK